MPAPGLCHASIQVNLRELEISAAAELEQLLAQCPDLEMGQEDRETVRKAAETDQKIERLVLPPVERSDVAALYVN